MHTIATGAAWALGLTLGLAVVIGLTLVVVSVLDALVR